MEPSNIPFSVDINIHHAGENADMDAVICEPGMISIDNRLLHNIFGLQYFTIARGFARRLVKTMYKL